MKMMKSLVMVVMLMLSVSMITACSAPELGGGNGGDTNPPKPEKPGKPGVTPIKFPDDPFSLLGVYDVVSYNKTQNKSINQAKGEFRVNVDISAMSAGGNPMVQMRLTLEDKKMELTREIDLKEMTGDLMEFISKTFTDLGATVTGKYTLDFAITGKVYPEAVENGFITADETLTINLDKTKDLQVNDGLDGDKPTEPEKVPVESVIIENKPASIVHGGESFTLKAKVMPENATNKEVEWTSSHINNITIDNTGKVTIKKYTSEPITITLKSKDNPEKVDTFTFTMEKAKVTGISLSQESATLTLRKDGAPVTTKITTIITPNIATEYTVVSYTSNNDSVATVDNKGVVTAVGEGDAIITVSAEGHTKQFNVKVNPAPAEDIPVTDITIDTPEKTYKTGDTVKIDFTLTPLNTTDTQVSYTINGGESVNVSTENGKGSISIPNIQENTKVVVTTMKNHTKEHNITVVKAIDKLEFNSPSVAVEQNAKSSVKDNIKNFADIENSIQSISYSVDKTDTASIDTATGEVTGLKNGVANVTVTIQPKYESQPVTASYEVDVLGLIDFTSAETFSATAQGTYEVTFFGTNPGKADGLGGKQTEVPVTTDCEQYKQLFKTSTCTGGGLVPNIIVDKKNFVGRATININIDGSAIIHTKILMTAPDMATNSPNDQYQYSIYRTTSPADSNNKLNTVNGIKGRHLTAEGQWDESRFDVRQYQNNFSKEIILYSHLKNKKITIPIFGEKTIHPITYVVMHKVSSKAEQMDYSDITKVPFDKVQNVKPTDLGKIPPKYD